VISLAYISLWEANNANKRLVSALSTIFVGISIGSVFLNEDLKMFIEMYIQKRGARVAQSV
jgi:hypothetical protein